MLPEYAATLIIDQHHRDLMDAAQQRRAAAPEVPKPVQLHRKHRARQHNALPPRRPSVNLTATVQPQLSTIEARYNR